MLEDRKALEWLCASAAHTTVQVFSTEEDFKAHLMTERGHTLSELQLSKIARRSMRPAFRIFDDCPLCDFVQSPSDISEREAQDILQRHIAEHLQALSLLSLPNRIDDGFTYESSEESSAVTSERSSLDLDPDALSFNSDPFILGEAVSVKQQESLSVEEQIGEHPDIGVAASDQEKYAEAENICRETLVLNLKDLVKDHPTTLRAMKNLGQALSNQRKYVEAEGILQATLLVTRKVLRPDNSETLVVMKTLGQALSSQGKHAELEQIYREVLFMVENAYGEEHPETLTALSNLGQTLSDLGKFAEAVHVFERALVVKKKMFGAENSSTLDTANRLVFSYWNQGQVDEAEAVYPRVLAGLLPSGHLPSKADILVIRDEDHFDSACQQLCQHLQQWVLRFSKFSDMRPCRLTNEINNEKPCDLVPPIGLFSHSPIGASYRSIGISYRPVTNMTRSHPYST
jgi:tetratricopeptide (TPR) repeat protein